MCKKNLPPRGCVLFVIDKIGNFVTIPVHAFGSESEHSTIYVPMFGGRISIGVQSKRFFFLSPPGGTNHRSHFPRTLPQQRKDGLLARKEDDGPRRQSPPLQYQRTSDTTRAALSRSRYSRRLVSWRYHAHAFWSCALVKSSDWTGSRNNGRLKEAYDAQGFLGAHRLRMHDPAGRCFSRYQATLLSRSYSTVNLHRCQCHVNKKSSSLFATRLIPTSIACTISPNKYD